MKKSPSTTAKSLSLCILTAFAVGGIADSTAIAAPELGLQQNSSLNRDLYSHGGLADQTVLNAEQTARVVNRHASVLRPAELQQINSLLNEVKAIARGMPGGDDGYFGGPASSVSVNIENSAYNFKARGTADLLVKCMNARQGNGGSVDDIEVSVDYLRSKKARNSSSWWKGSLEACAVVAGLAADLGMQKGLNRGNVLVAFSIEDSESMTHIIRGYSVGEIGDKCMQQLRTPGSFDDLSISVNGQQFIEKRNSASFWRTKSEACRMVAQAAAQYGL